MKIHVRRDSTMLNTPMSLHRCDLLCKLTYNRMKLTYV